MGAMLLPPPSVFRGKGCPAKGIAAMGRSCGAAQIPDLQAKPLAGIIRGPASRAAACRVWGSHRTCRSFRSGFNDLQADMGMDGKRGRISRCNGCRPRQ